MSNLKEIEKINNKAIRNNIFIIINCACLAALSSFLIVYVIMLKDNILIFGGVAYFVLSVIYSYLKRLSNKYDNDCKKLFNKSLNSFMYKGDNK